MKQFFCLLFILSTAFLVGQTSKDVASKSFAENYKRNIKKSRINGVYIPRSINDAMKQLERKSDAQAVHAFTSAQEDVVAKKLHFGLGRWMVQNWNLEYGSRLSVKLTELGLKNPDEMSQLLIRSFHRYLNEKPIKAQEIADVLIKEREKKKAARFEGKTIKTLSSKKIEQ